MALEAIGAGLGRTGTQSLRFALERLLGGPCYFMRTLLFHPEHLRVWESALAGEAADWDAVFGECRSTVDWTAALYFRELADAYPDALVVLSLRDPDRWWPSVNSTVFEALRADRQDDPLARALEPTRQFTLRTLETRFTPDWNDEVEAKAAFERHNDAVRTAIPPDRLIEWRPADGWGPICAALGVPAPAEPFPHANTAAEFQERHRL